MHRILVVDDEPAVLRLARTILEKFGFVVLAANDAAEALHLLAGHEVDALLTDVNLPGMSGPELIVEARKRRPGLPACCMTAYVGGPHPQLQQVPVIAKPFSPYALNEVVRRMLTSAGSRMDMPGTELRPEMVDAEAKWVKARTELAAIISEGADALPYPDGLLRVEQAGRKMSLAYTRLKETFENYRDVLRRAQPNGPADTTNSGITPTLPKTGILSRREREVLQLIAEGLTTKKIGAQLGISFKTAAAHRTKIMRKLNIRNVALLVRHAIRHKLVEP